MTDGRGLIRQISGNPQEFQEGISELMCVTVKVVICEAFVEAILEAPKHLARSVHDVQFRAEIRGVPPRTDLKSLECDYLRIQRKKSHPTVQGYDQAGRVPGGSTSNSLTIAST